MTYAVSASLQAAVYQHLADDPVLAGLVGAAVFDALPAGNVPPLYVSLGPEEVRDRSDLSGNGAEHKFTVTVVSGSGGFAAAKSAAAAVCDALVDAPLVLARGRLVGLRFQRAAARQARDGGRSISLRFAARVEDG